MEASVILQATYFTSRQRFTNVI